ncbi:MAG: 16S rRNA (cytosine(1402)-N(4))-methyltransferase, partial [Candidatus Omnitrophica bacterium]|nr:16S rRNA (cytosine(1402)-N(4))-methyltransferase [Candidatus Omnitrophota bacterium]
VSSHQFDEAARGFSTRFDAKLDMRMDQHLRLTAREVVNTYEEDQLRRIFTEYGELENAGRLARRWSSQVEEEFPDGDAMA